MVRTKYRTVFTIYNNPNDKCLHMLKAKMPG